MPERIKKWVPLLLCAVILIEGFFLYNQHESLTRARKQIEAGKVLLETETREMNKEKQKLLSQIESGKVSLETEKQEMNKVKQELLYKDEKLSEAEETLLMRDSELEEYRQYLHNFFFYPMRSIPVFLNWILF